MQVDLSWNDLGPEGGKAVADALRVSGSLTSLDLEASEMGGVRSLNASAVFATQAQYTHVLRFG